MQHDIHCLPGETDEDGIVEGHNEITIVPAGHAWYMGV